MDLELQGKPPQADTEQDKAKAVEATAVEATAVEAKTEEGFPDKVEFIHLCR